MPTPFIMPKFDMDQEEATIVEAKINCEFPADSFQVEFPVDTFVLDATGPP